MRRRRIANLLVLAVAAFVIAFAVARAAGGGDSSEAASQPAPRSFEPVAIENLDRTAQVKPLRSAPGTPPADEVP